MKPSVIITHTWNTYWFAFLKYGHVSDDAYIGLTHTCYSVIYTV